MRMFVFFLALGLATADGPKIFIVTDMEGVGGVNNADEQLMVGQRRYAESCRLLAGEVNAAVTGALEAGASQVVIWDGHDSSRSLSIDQIHPRAKLLQGEPIPANYYFSEKLYDGILFVGQHAMAGAKGGVLAHSQNFDVRNIFLNNRAVGEIGLITAIAGQFDIPVIMLSGDQAACDELLALQPKAETVAVKRLAGQNSTLSLSHAEACSRIQGAAQRAVSRAREFSSWKIGNPVEMKIEYSPVGPNVYASAQTHGEGKQVTGLTLVYLGRTVLEAYQRWRGE